MLSWPLAVCYCELDKGESCGQSLLQIRELSILNVEQIPTGPSSRFNGQLQK